MRVLCLVIVGLLCVSFGVNSYLLGSRECTWGPSYWCKNLTNAKECTAVQHCIQTVWVHQKLPPDNDDVCDICLEMVKEARDQLESNETQEELKEVFEGSCKLIPVKVVSEACCKIADEFIPELVETLASEMNPQVVCSVAGLCNNEWVDKQLADMKAGLVEATPVQKATDENSCSGCRAVVDAMDHRLQSMSRDEVLNTILQVCGRTGSFSDGCSAIVITYFNDIYNFMQHNFKSDGLCHIAGVCSSRFHAHRPDEKKIEVIHESDVGVVKPKEDLPCELCEDLVTHLRDILVANTTEEEFEQVLEGLCKQTKSFKDECLSLVTEYYAVIYNFLVNNLVPEDVCKLCGLCGQPGVAKGPIWPLLPAETVETLKVTVLSPGQVKASPLTRDTIKAVLLTPAEQIGPVKATLLKPAQPAGAVKATPLKPAELVVNIKIPMLSLSPASELHRVPIGDHGGVVKVMDVENNQLPIERTLPQTVMYVGNKEACTFCQYLLHYVQQAITSESTEEEIEKVVKEVCDHLPDSVQGQCREFIDTYGNAFIALLAQEIDPSVVCPKLGLCPGQDAAIALDMNHTVNDKPTCPLCLLAIQSLINKLKDRKTEEDIKRELDNLCQDLPKSLAQECQDFVDQYSQQIIDMIIADFTPAEICAFLKLCDPTVKEKKATTLLPDILSNEIPTLSSEKKKSKKAALLTPASPLAVKGTGECVLCEFILSKIDEELKNDTTEEEIKELVKDVCNHLPKSVANECKNFVDQYGDLLIALLAQSLDPKEVCETLSLCPGVGRKHQVLMESIKKSVRECGVCEAAMGALDGLLGDSNLQRNVDELLKKVCSMLPADDRAECHQLIDVYGPSILNIIAHVADARMVCMEIGICTWESQSVHLLGGKKCVWGPGYWCQSMAHAKSCDTVEHCQEKVWKAKKPMNNY